MWIMFKFPGSVLNQFEQFQGNFSCMFSFPFEVISLNLLKSSAITEFCSLWNVIKRTWIAEKHSVWLFSRLSEPGRKENMKSLIFFAFFLIGGSQSLPVVSWIVNSIHFIRTILCKSINYFKVDQKSKNCIWNHTGHDHQF